jgi:hypothetical protein
VIFTLNTEQSPIQENQIKDENRKETINLQHDKGDYRQGLTCVLLEVFTAATVKNAVIWDVTLFGSCNSRRFGGTYIVVTVSYY